MAVKSEGAPGITLPSCYKQDAVLFAMLAFAAHLTGALITPPASPRSCPKGKSHVNKKMRFIVFTILQDNDFAGTQ